MDCIFCDIANKVTRAKIVYETDKYIAFENINPSAPIHILLIPKEHIDKKDAISGKYPNFWSEIMLEANNVIKKLHLDETGYRIVNNGAGFHAIDHEHIHIMGGNSWKPSDNL
jgi:histidine triad (HIT) family protein